MENNQNPGRPAPLPLDEWRADMDAAVAEIRAVGMELLKVHRAAGETAEERARNWRLEERQKEEHNALQQLFDASKAILGKLDAAMRQADPQAMAAASETIDQSLPRFEAAFVTIRHAALDLLRWAGRAGRIEGSPLPEQYRASYAKLVAYAPKFKPRLEAMQQELLERARDPGAGEQVQALLSAITRFNGAMDASRRFVQAIVDPPLELTFQETNGFLEDWEAHSVEERGRLASELNDCCQFLLYDEAEFEQRTEAIQPPLADGMEASLFALPVKDIRILFTVDEDPLFGQLTVTLLRAVRADCHDEACESIIQTLYEDLIGGDSHG